MTPKSTSPQTKNQVSNTKVEASFRSQLQEEFSPQQLLSNLIAGLVVGIIGVTMCVSYAALIFSEELANFLTRGVGITFFSAALLCSIVALFSSSSAGMIAIPLPAAVPILALMVADIGEKIPEEASLNVLLATALCTLALTSLLTGISLLILGQLKAGQLIRYIPYPVVGGFLAGVGWLLFKGGIEVTTGIEISFSQLPILFHSDLLFRWLPGLIFAVVLLLISRRYKHFLILPVSLILAVSLFYLVLALTQTSFAEATAQGWLLGPFPEGNSWQLLGLGEIKTANWSLIFDQVGSMGAIVVITTLELLLTASSMELITNREIDLNRELQAAGIANLASGLGGGLVGCHLTSLGILASKMGATRRLVGLTAAAVFAIMLVLGTSLLSFFPKVVLGGFLLLLALNFLVEWLYDAWFELPRSDYFLVVFILLVIGTFEILEGVLVGLVVAVILFAIKYSQIEVTKHTFSGVNRKSYVQRSLSQEHLLQKQGKQIYILELQGFIFFGTSNKLLNQVRTLLSQNLDTPLKFVVLDFRLVNGLDSSAVVSFTKLKQLSRKEQFSLVLTTLNPQAEKLLEQGGVLEGEDALLKVFPDLDRGLEWCEDQILETYHLHRLDFQPLSEQLQAFFPDSQQVATLMNYLKLLQISPDDFIFRKGDPADGLYFVESGQVSVIFELPTGQIKRVQTYYSGTILGEIGHYMNAPRTASIIADQPSRLYYLSTQAFEQMEAEQSQLASEFHKFIVKLLAERLKQRSQELQNLLQ
ncbi:MAG: SulP family inorganic anion transporter [Lyngbya sp.]|nr:SulP family inorganic anion transporter [Lyngbya sp.]